MSNPETVEEEIGFKENENKIKKKLPELDVSYLLWWLITDCPPRPPIQQIPLSGETQAEHPPPAPPTNSMDIFALFP